MRSCCQTGVTLVELMVTIVILAVLLTLAVPSFSAWVANNQVRNAAEELRNGLQGARADAVRTNALVGYDLTTQVAGTNNTNRTVTPNGTTVVTFNGIGRRTFPAGGVVRVEIRPAVGNCGELLRCLDIEVTTMGQVRICNPARPADDPQGCQP